MHVLLLHKNILILIRFVEQFWRNCKQNTFKFCFFWNFFLFFCYGNNRNKTVCSVNTARKLKKFFQLSHTKKRNKRRETRVERGKNRVSKKCFYLPLFSKDLSKSSPTDNKRIKMTITMKENSTSNCCPKKLVYLSYLLHTQNIGK